MVNKGNFVIENKKKFNKVEYNKKYNSKKVECKNCCQMIRYDNLKRHMETKICKHIKLVRDLKI